MKVQVKRVKTVLYPNPTEMDSKFVNALLLQLPEIGESLTIDLFSDRWHTTDVKYVLYKRGTMEVITRNSIYRFKLGWKGN